MVSLPAELVAAAVVVQFWSTINSAIWITVFGVLLVISNVLFVRVYGELEFTFASLKIMLIIGLNIMVRAGIRSFIAGWFVLTQLVGIGCDLWGRT